MNDESPPPYPVVSSRHLDPPATRGWRSLGGPRRDPSELPRLGPHQVAVYRVGETWVEDQGSLDPRSDTAVSASSVSVVDKRRNVLVEAMVTIPSADTTDFAVRGRFRCTVDDAVALMREGGPADAAEALTSYLRGCPGLGEEGLDYGAEQLTEARKNVSVRVTAYSLAEPPELPGMTVELVGTELLTPSQLRDFHKKLEELELRRRQNEVEQAVEQDRRKREREYQQQLELLDRRHQEELQRRDQDIELQLAEQRAAYEREQEALDAGQTAKLGSRWALLRAYRRKELTAEQLADRLATAEHDVRQAEERRDETERALLERLSNLWREDLVRESERTDRRWELQREEKVRELEAMREERLARTKEQREDQLRREQQQREDTLRSERDKRARADRQQEMHFELYKKLIQEGHTATTPIDMQGLLERIIGGSLAPGAGDDGKQLESGALSGDEPSPGTDGESRPNVPADATARVVEDEPPHDGDHDSDTFDIGDVGREENGY